MADGWFPLELFPDGPLAGSVIVTVFIGAVVMAFFSETYGWIFSGIVVPGYLAPILLVEPFSAGVIVVEAVLTCLIVEWLATRLPERSGWWAPLFGRDRFLCVIFVSVAVRLVMELFALPELGYWVQSLFPEFDYRNKFTGIGLIVVPLLANMLWKPGLGRGCTHAAVAIALTWAIVNFVLVPYTNFSVDRFHFLYEEAALDFAASPRTYIILLVGVFLAAQVNQYLGWDFGGVMVPALLAVAWLTPHSLLATIGEGAVILGIARLIVMLPGIRDITIEGPRLLCLLFIVSFSLKMLVGHVTTRLWPGFPYENLSGYGYLLSTLLALKMWQKNIFARLALPMLKVSVASLLLGTFLGWALLPVDPGVLFQVEGASRSRDAGKKVIQQPPYEVVVKDLTHVLRPGGKAKVVKMMPSEAHLFQEIISALSEVSRKAVPGERLAWARTKAARLGMEVVKLEDEKRNARYLYFREQPDYSPRRGWGMALFRLGSKSRLLIEAPRPIGEPRTAEAAIVLLELTGAHALILPGAHFRTNPDGTADAFRWSRLPFRLAHSRLRRHNILEVRALPQGDVSAFWVESVLSEEVRLRNLQRWLGGAVNLALPPKPPPVENGVLRQHVRSSYCTLALAPLAARTLLAARYRESLEEAARTDRPLTVDVGHVARRINERIEQNRRVRRFKRQQPDRSELLYIDQQVLTPLVDAAAKEAEMDDDEEARGKRLAVEIPPISAAARQVGYRVDLVRHRSGQLYVILSEDRSTLRGWGTYAIRFGKARPLHLLAPFPMSEQYTSRVAIDLLVALNARALSISSIGPLQAATRDLDAQVRFENLSVYQLFHQVIQRRLWEKENVLSLEIRGASHWPVDVKEDGILREGNLLGGARAVSSEVKDVHAALRMLGLSTILHTGSEKLLRFGLSNSPQYRYSLNHGAGPFAAAWLSRESRQRFRDAGVSSPRAYMLQSTGIPIRTISIAEWLRKAPSRSTVILPAGDPWERFREPVSEALAYVNDRNVLRIERLLRACRQSKVGLLLLKDADRDLPVLAMEATFFPDQQVCALVNLSPMSKRRVQADWEKITDGTRVLLDERPLLMLLGMPLP